VRLFSCPDLEPLIEELARELRNPLSDPMMEEIVVVPSANKLAAISFKTLFLAPPTATSPANRLPPVTRKRSPTGSA
jgi:hypothetical protein